METALQAKKKNSDSPIQEEQKKDEFWQEVDCCDYCGHKSFVHYMKSSVPPWYKGEPIQMMRCEQCDMVMASPRPERQTLYANYLEGHETAQKAVKRKLDRPNINASHTRQIEHALKFAPDAKRLFDMGCGAGTIMQAAKEKGLEAEGNEINLAACDHLNGLGFTAYHGFTCDLELPENHYDIVINFDYLEHSYEPYQDLLTCNRILTDGGVLYLKTLFLGCPDHITKGDGYQLFGNGHFSYFFPRTLCSMIHSAGFEIEELKLGNLIFVIARKTRTPGEVDINRYRDPAYAMS